MIRPNPVLAAKHQEMAAFVRDTINGVVKHHFPDATPHHISDTPSATGIDAKPMDGKSGTRVFAAELGNEDMYPGFLHSSHSMPEGALKKPGMDDKHQAMRSDLNRLITGSAEGEKNPVTAAKDAAGTPTSTTTMDRVTSSLSTQYPEGALNVLVYGTLAELYDRMKANLAQDTNADLRAHAPRGGMATAV